MSQKREKENYASIYGFFRINCKIKSEIIILIIFFKFFGLTIKSSH